MLYVFDLDGTICFDGKSIDQKIVESLRKLITKDNKVIFASARPIRDMVPLLTNFSDCDLIGGNGSITRVNGITIPIKTISDTAYEHIKQVIQKYNLEYIIDDKMDYSAKVSADNKILKQLDPGKLAHNISSSQILNPIKIILLNIKEEDLKHIKRNLNQIKDDCNIIIHNQDGNIDITAQDINKYTSLKRLVRDSPNYIAWGNDCNDSELLKKAQIGYFISADGQVLEDLAAYKNIQIISDISDIPDKILEVSS